MTIQFRCEHCRKEVRAPDSAGGKRGRCPYCRQSNSIPAPVSEEGALPLQEVDEAEEAKRREQAGRLRQQERALIAEMGAEAPVPLEQRDDLAPEDLYHFVVNYCLDLASGKLDRCPEHVRKLKQFPGLARQALEDFLSGKAHEPALGRIPARVLQGFLGQLRDQLK